MAGEPSQQRTHLLHALERSASEPAGRAAAARLGETLLDRRLVQLGARSRRFAALERALREAQRERRLDKLGHSRVSERGGDGLGTQRHGGEEAETELF